jgi:hypothetical protein
VNLRKDVATHVTDGANLVSIRAVTLNVLNPATCGLDK